MAQALKDWLLSRPTWAIAAAVGTPVALYLLWSKCGSDWASQQVLETDFDSFLVQQGEHPTGLGPGAASSKAKKGTKQPVARQSGAPFEAFLRAPAGGDADHDEDTRDPLDFSSFLKSSSSKAPSTQKQVPAGSTQQAGTGPQGPQPDQARVLVMFGTEYGFSKEIAEKLCSKLNAAGKYWPVLVDMAEHPDGYDFSQEQVVLVACSTQGDGVPPTEARSFCDWLFAGKASSLGHLRFSVIALGDKSYTHFCRCGKQVEAALSAGGAQPLHTRVDVNKEDWAAVDGWIGGVVDALAKLELKPVGDAAAAAGQHAGGEAKKAGAKKFGKARPYPARVLAVEGLCNVSGLDDKNTIRVEFELGPEPELAYLPGDALGIYPANAPEYVSELLGVLGADAEHQVAPPSWHYELPQGRPQSLSLQDALTYCYDLKTPKAELFQLLWQAYPEAARQQASGKQTATNGHANMMNGHAANGMNGHGTADVEVVACNGSTKAKGTVGSDLQAQVQALHTLVTGGAAAQEEYFAHGRHVIDVLRQFNAAKLSPAQVLGTLRQLQPRLYSISSAPHEAASPRVQATIAEVRYQALDCPRVGVCSTYVSSRIQAGQVVPVYIHRNPDFRLPPSLATPLLMVGPGTGLAPFRSFILDRLIAAGRLPGGDDQQGTQPPAEPQALGEMVLFFGCRRADQDYLYGQQLEAWAAAGHITLHTAFSRQQAHKVYVQDRLREQADAVWQLLDGQGAHFYVCGDAANMAGAVEVALLDILAARLPGGSEAAQAYLQALSSSGRYQRDVWY